MRKSCPSLVFIDIAILINLIDENQQQKISLWEDALECDIYS
ncbi:MAG: hypothetical protein ACHBN1_08635 [Heteroscytonema crispum UTEX LB 1556]